MKSTEQIPTREAIEASSAPDDSGLGWTAFELDRLKIIAFSPSDVPEDVRRKLTERFGGSVKSGVRLDEPRNLHLWPDGAPRPEVLLCQSRRDPRQYRVFKYRSDIDDSEYQETGRTYAVFPDWDKFAKIFGELDEIAGHSDVDESPEVDAVLSNIGRGSFESHGA